MDINGFYVVLFICPPTIISCPQNQILSLRMNSKHIYTKCFGDTLASIQFELKYWTGKSMTLFSSTHCLATCLYSDSTIISFIIRSTNSLKNANAVPLQWCQGLRRPGKLGFLWLCKHKMMLQLNKKMMYELLLLFSSIRVCVNPLSYKQIVI